MRRGQASKWRPAAGPDPGRPPSSSSRFGSNSAAAGCREAWHQRQQAAAARDCGTLLLTRGKAKERVLERGGGALLKRYVNGAEKRRAMGWAGASAPEHRGRLPGPPRLPCAPGLLRGRRDPDQSAVRVSLIWCLPARRWMRLGRRQPVMPREEMTVRWCCGASGRQRGSSGWQHRWRRAWHSA
jgi:hypothetical protein